MKKSILIFGKKGSGKTTKARVIAETYSNPLWLYASNLHSQFGLSYIANDPTIDVVIFEDVDMRRDIDKMEELAINEILGVEVKYKDVQLVKIPDLIFTVCTSAAVDLIKKKVSSRLRLIGFKCQTIEEFKNE